MIKKSVILWGVIGAGTLLVSAVSMGAPSDARLVRVNEACAQATECSKEVFKVCTTYHSEYLDYSCSKGCSKPELEP